MVAAGEGSEQFFIAACGQMNPSIRIGLRLFSTHRLVKILEGARKHRFTGCPTRRKGPHARHGLRYATYAEMKAASFEYIEVFHNRTRQHSTLGYQPPIQYLTRWRNKQYQEKIAA